MMRPGEPRVRSCDNELRRVGATLATRTAYRRWAELGCRADVDQLLHVAFTTAERAIGEHSVTSAGDPSEAERRLEHLLVWALSRTPFGDDDEHGAPRGPR